MAKNHKSYFNGVTLFHAQAALKRVSHRFETDGCALAIISEDMYPDVLDLLKHHFVPDEATHNGFGVEWEENSKNKLLGVLRKNLSVMMLSADGVRVMGVLLLQPIQSGDVSELDQIKYEPFRDFMKFLKKQSEDIDFFSRFGVDVAMYFSGLVTHKDYRRRGVAKKMFGASVALAAELGFKAVKVEAASNYTQMICNGERFQVLREVPYDQYVYNGEALRSKTGPHTSFKIYGKALNK